MPTDDEWDLTLPVEYREESRIAIGHTAAQWKFRLEEFHFRCAYCGIHQRATPERRLFRDHVHPVSRRGSDAIENIVPACWACNERKGKYLPGEVTRWWWVVPEPKPRRRKADTWRIA